ncbi:MAG TPA: DUF4431 domain-containing protein [Pyrinomonadaceae bacterium]|nr:DUF4431 domain-containing protein [Pyrinomonadaceae bacterium]
MVPRAYSKILTLLLLLCASAVCATAQQCLSYEPAEVQLSGTISKQVVPGPPNYQNVRKGDKPETIWILTLDKAICVTGNTDDVNEPEEDVTDLQLVLQQNHFAQLRRMTGQKVQVVSLGKLFHAHTAHHRTKVLLDVKEISQQR